MSHVQLLLQAVLKESWICLFHITSKYPGCIGFCSNNVWRRAGAVCRIQIMCCSIINMECENPVAVCTPEAGALTCATKHLWLWDLSIGLHRDQWCNWMTTNTQLYLPLLLWNNIPTIINCGISAGMQAISELVSSRNNCTSTNHTGSLIYSLMSYSRTATCILWQHKTSHISVHCMSGDRWKVSKLVVWDQASSFLAQHLRVSLLCLGQAAKALLLLLISLGSANRWSSSS